MWEKVWDKREGTEEKRSHKLALTLSGIVFYCASSTVSPASSATAIQTDEDPERLERLHRPA